ncbi:sulfurtransferase [Auritidibacter ignavus]|uniref:Sulfurtransferase n=1 Tax=Auritidibacter ignavus TaxID=678932 RepID=A0AAJ6APH0_9MICC|nr:MULTISPECIES: sulfurtransferase [Auritidibacter]AXR73218.1 sulfurtransferase [Auritidibacter sp. NML130574]WGH94448.1 sulfurtransferase [Auritidibacter ignavus]
MTSLGHTATEQRPAALISDQVLSYWLRHDDEQHVQEDPGTQPEGFVATDQAPQAGHLVILDVRWSATEPGEGHERYRQGHIPGAVFVSMSGQLSGHGAPSEGRHPLPDASRFTDAVRMLGINDGDTVVVYDDVASTSAPRAWWLLRYAGMERVYVLDGGLHAWREAGLPLQAGEALPAIGKAHISWGKMPVVGTEEVEALAADDNGVLLDARDYRRYTGEEEPIDPVAGHIPGAVSAPVSELTDETGRFLPAQKLREHFASRGVAPEHAVGVYCGSGVTASAEVLALYIAGMDVALYPGSFSAWINAGDRPVATGEHPY